MTQLIEESKSDLEYNVDHIIETLESGHYETEDENGPNGFDYLTDALDINYIINGDKKDNLYLDQACEEFYNC